MTTIQKTIVTATLAILAGAGIYEARQASQSRDQVQALQQQQGLLAGQLRQLQGERDAATNRLALLAEGMASTKSNNTELLKLRGEVTRLRAAAGETVLLPANVPHAVHAVERFKMLLTMLRG